MESNKLQYFVRTSNHALPRLHRPSNWWNNSLQCCVVVITVALSGRDLVPSILCRGCNSGIDGYWFEAKTLHYYCVGGEGHGRLVYQIYLVYRELCLLVQYTCPIVLPLISGL